MLPGAKAGVRGLLGAASGTNKSSPLGLSCSSVLRSWDTGDFSQRQRPVLQSEFGQAALCAVLPEQLHLVSLVEHTRSWSGEGLAEVKLRFLWPGLEDVDFCRGLAANPAQPRVNGLDWEFLGCMWLECH